MSALQFLNKKSWHTATIRNNEKVWLKEQAAAKEQQRIDELQKQLAEERKIAEIQRLELESGRLQPDQLLKRRRLNWMYEHGPANTPDQKKKEDEKQREDVLLGKKKLEADPKSSPPHDKVVMVDMEAKLREDPMFQVELHRVRMERTHSSPDSCPTEAPHNDDETDAKRARKEGRRRLRQERRLKREERKMRKRQRSLVQQDTSHVTPRSYHREAQAQCGLPRGDGTGDHREDAKYGLHIPHGGSGVEVSTEFVPRTVGKERRKSRWDVGPSSQSPRKASSDDVNCAERRGSGRPPLSPTLKAKAEEKRRAIQEMKDEALRLDTERRRRAQRHVTEANREREELDDRVRRRKSQLSVADQEPAVRFARQTIARGASAAERIRERRAWSAGSGDACY